MVATFPGAFGAGSIRLMHSGIKPETSTSAANLASPADQGRGAFSARIEPGGLTFAAPDSLTLLQAAELAASAGLKMDSSCRNGTCRTCICKLTSGQVVYRIKWPGLSAEEKSEGFILPCVAYPASDVVIELAV